MSNLDERKDRQAKSGPAEKELSPGKQNSLALSQMERRRKIYASWLLTLIKKGWP